MDERLGSWRLMQLAVLALILAAATQTRADDRVDPRETEARALFERGREAYANGEYQRAYDQFEASYLRLQRPALLFDMAKALQRLERPHDAAEQLRAYLRVRLDDPDHDAIEQQIRALDEKQRILDDQRRRISRPELNHGAEPVRAIVASAVTPLPARSGSKRTRGLIVGLSVAGAIVAAVAVGIAVGFSVSTAPEPYTTTPLGAHPGTR